ncbi:MAG: serine--tRNA ligase [Planctomycetota bacterium]|jgi:seryl-tRNA synthetase
MLDLKFVREHPEVVRENCTHRRMPCDVDRILSLAARRSDLITRAETIRHDQKALGKMGKERTDPEARAKLKEEGRALKEALTALTAELETVETDLDDEMRRVPNLSHPDAPVGEGEEANREIRRHGQPRTFDFPPKDHVALGKELDLIDLDSGTRVTGRSFYFLKREAVLLEMAMQRFALDLLMEEGFIPVSTPDLAKHEILDGIGFAPRGPETQIYSVEGTDLGLIATAEITLGGLQAGQILTERELPLLFAGVSHCFRTEAGAHGRAAKGLYRVHQFSKTEMFAYTTPETSDAMLERLLGIEERIFNAFEVPFRVVDTCTGELGGPAYRKYDLEAWMPGRGDGGDWGEVTSTSNCTDYQARRLKVRFRPRDQKALRFVHTLNGTAVATSRALIAILENHQQADGSIRIPEALHAYTGFERIEPRPT